MTSTQTPAQAAIQQTVEALAAAAAPPGPVITIGEGPRNARTDPDSGLRFYRASAALQAAITGLPAETLADRDLVSVTSARRMAGVPHGLHQWSLTQVVNRALDSLSSIVQRVSTGDPGQVALAKTELRRAATEERDRAAVLGRAVHDAAERGLALTQVGPEVAPRLRWYYDWLAVSGAEILGKEFQVWNLGVGYAGTADLLVRFPLGWQVSESFAFPPGAICVVDNKTGKSVFSEHALQTLAYLMADVVATDDRVDEHLTALLRQASGMGVLHLANDHWEFRVLRADPATWAAYRGLVAFALWMHEHSSVETVTAAARRSEAA